MNEWISTSAILVKMPGLNRCTGFYAGERKEYVGLTVRQHRAGLLRLAATCSGGGAIFPVGKSGGRQRAVWHGSRVSESAAIPPGPRHLADPCAFAHLGLSDGRRLRVTKRECRYWFYQLVLPAGLRNFMARPRVSRKELHDAGFTDVDIAHALDDRSDSKQQYFFPLAATWSMGFSWSSYVAQETLLSIHSKADSTSDVCWLAMLLYLTT